MADPDTKAAGEINGDSSCCMIASSLAALLTACRFSLTCSLALQ